MKYQVAVLIWLSKAMGILCRLMEINLENIVEIAQMESVKLHKI